MRKPIFSIIMAGILCGGIFLLTGCKDDADMTAPEPTCSISVYSPQVNDVFRSMPTRYGSEDLINIRWEGSRGGEVRIDLYCGSEMILNITPKTENDGFYFWYAAPADLPTNEDYHILVTALSAEGCEDFGPCFCVVKPEECSLEASTTWAGWPLAPLNRESQMVIVWDSAGDNGEVDIQLWRAHFVLGRFFVGKIVTLPDQASPFTWDVGEYGLEQTGSQDRYYVQVVDHDDDTCTKIGSYFEYYP